MLRKTIQLFSRFMMQRKYQKQFQMIRPPVETRRIIDRERYRADRNGHELSLIVFQIDPGDASLGKNCHFLHLLSRRVRCYDEIGWYDPSHIVVILPYTSTCGAKKLAEDIGNTMVPVYEPLPYSIYSYPSDWLISHNLLQSKGEFNPGPVSEVHRNGPVRMSAVSPSLEKRQNGAGTPTYFIPPGIQWPLKPRPALDPETLFVDPLPFWKRAVDVLCATAALVVLSPMLLTVAAAIKWTSPGPVFFVQERTGHNCRRFTMYKFRTMVDGASAMLDQVRHLNEMNGPLIKIERDPRLTPIGGFLRKTSLDELPQLINVLKGDMTLIGPRALSPKPSEYDRWQLPRFKVVPGIACAWQAERRGDVDFNEWMRSDLKYIRDISPWNDLCLLFHTLKGVVLCRGGR
ncbi:MAG: sugar transferase [bacterium]